MPELPEVETIVRGLGEKVKGRTFLDVWTDSPALFKKVSFKELRKRIKGKRINGVRRRGKNIIFDLTGNYALLVHQKITGHLLLGKWKKQGRVWVSKTKGVLLSDPMNQFLRAIFFLSGNLDMALSDLRKFAKIELWEKKELEEYLKSFGPEPLSKEFTLNGLKKLFSGKKGKIKQILMDQSFIAGIGNIYASEILWEARIAPTREAGKIKEKELKRIYLAIKKILKKAIKLQGDSFSDFRKVSGEKGRYQDFARVYQKEGEKCPVCRGRIKRIKQGGRSSFFCPSCQK
ncbi:MAG: bifunctional DNA-formamidopyrimidine glycosylase/DNA-(apurinic or apyrimidinic site) lyase [Candidatus Pacebacteria bacterium]|nr:bifunctional DNA-formamidopyrimidine glycosylase/DNA-(apurinic or apyrimidinic site) lyase [Candidatus Paceibacterota bacterium]